MTQESADTRITGFDHHDPEHYRDAEEVWKAMRSLPGLARSDKYGGFYVLARYDDVLAAAVNHRAYCSGQGINIPPLPLHAPMIPVEVDPPLHGQYRRLLTDFLTRDRVRSLEPAVREYVVGLLDAVRGQRRVEFVQAVARPLPVMVALKLLGLPVEDAGWIHERLTIQRKQRGASAGTTAAQEVGRYIEDLVVRHETVAKSADDDILSAVVLGRVDGRTLTLDEKVSTIRLLLFGGFDTTALALARMAHWMAQHPQDVEDLRSMGDDELDVAIEEFVRFASPGSYLRRTVTTDTELHGCPLHAGDKLLMSYMAANRDPARFDRPNEVQIRRSPNPHVGFGAGPHRCIGSFVAKLEIRVALDELLRRYRSLRLDPDGEVVWECEEGLGIIRLPLVVEER